MATKQEIDAITSQISELKNKLGPYESAIQSSSTAYSEGSPSYSDLQNQIKLENVKKQIQKLQDSKLKAEWYGDTKESGTGEAEGVKMGLIGRGIDVISRPMYGIAGAAKHLVGQGKGTLVEDIVSNVMKEKSTFGDIFKTAGVPKILSAPLGFAFDLAFDPVNWATVGTSALVPKLIYGFGKGIGKKAVIEGVASAAKAGVLEKASTVTRLTPWFRKTATAGKVKSAALQATEKWEKFADLPISDVVKQRGFGYGSHRWTMSVLMDDIAERSPAGKKAVDWVNKYFKYDPGKGWVRDAKIMQVLIDTFGTSKDLDTALTLYRKGNIVGAEKALATGEIKGGVRILEAKGGKTMPSIDISPSFGNEKKAAAFRKAIKEGDNDFLSALANEADEAEEVMKNTTAGISPSAVENADRIASIGEAIRIASAKTGSSVVLDDILRLSKTNAWTDTGVKWFDKVMTDVRTAGKWKFKYADKIEKVMIDTMKNYDRAMAIFRVAKVGASPTAWTNAVVGNLVMTHMALGHISGLYLKRLLQASRFMDNKPGSAMTFVRELIKVGGEKYKNEVMKALAENRIAIGGTIGSDFRRLAAGENFPDVLTKMALKTGTIDKDSEILFRQQIKDVIKDLNITDKKVLAQRGLGGAEESGLERAFSEVERAGVENPNPYLMGTGIGPQELMKDPAGRELLLTIKKKAKESPDNLGWKFLDILMNKSSSFYEKFDQKYKLASIWHSVLDGYTRSELMNLRHLIEIPPEGLMEHVVDGQRRWRIPVQQAIELANTQYMNYAAMPAAIRVLRNMPLLGSPFSSFMYGMALKTGQSLAYNPSVFTKIGFGMKEFSGDKSALEKKALEGPYYSYLNKQGMFRLPGEAPIYVNLANMLPYYSLNMFNPSEASFNTNALPAKVVSFLQKSPILKDPVGSVIFDYLIQPLILGEAIAPKGQFGQALYPYGASATTKGLYGLRAGAEAFVPNILSLAGLVTPASELWPSYRWRDLAGATEGKNALGISTTEGKPSRVFRKLGSIGGFPVQSEVNTTFAKKEATQ